MNKILTEKQRCEIGDLSIEDRVELIREIFWNGEIMNDDYTKTIGFEDTGTTPENMEYFLKGATAMFDAAQMTAANHWHGREEVNDICQLENNFLLDTMENAFEQINPKQMAIWKELSK